MSVGAFVVAKMAWKFLVFVNDFFLVGRNNLKKYKKHGSWARTFASLYNLYPRVTPLHTI
jgi:hypothetical protein